MAPTPRPDLAEFAAFLARVTLEVERNLRSPDQLARLLTPTGWIRWQHTRRPGVTPGGPVVPDDIGRPRIQQADDGTAIVNVVTRTEPSRWGALTMRLEPAAGSWQASSLARLYAARDYRTGPTRPPPDAPIETRLRLARTDRFYAQAAAQAAARQATQRVNGSRPRPNPNGLSTGWQKVLAELDREITTLQHQRDTANQIQRTLRRRR